MSKLLALFKHAFETRPIITNSIIYGTFFVGSEFAQEIITRKILPDKKEDIDKKQLLRYAFYGTCIQGPILTTWFRYLDRTVPGATPKAVARKVLTDHFCSVPLLLVLFYVSFSIMEGKEDIFEECRSKWVQTFLNSCMFWLPAQTLNFSMVPPKFRIVYIGTASLIWINILCYLKRQKFESKYST